MRKVLISTTAAAGLLLGLAPVASAGIITDVVVGHDIHKAVQHHEQHHQQQQQQPAPAPQH